MFFENKAEYWYEYDEEKPRKYSEDGQMKDVKQTLDSMNAFLLLVVMSYLGSRFKLLRMSWYRIMKPFRNHLKLDIGKYLCIWHKYFPGIDSSSNDLMLSGSIKNISSYNFI